MLITLLVLLLVLQLSVGFSPLVRRYRAAPLFELDCRKGAAKNAGDVDHARYGEVDESNKTDGAVPMVESRRKLFGTLQLPRDSIDQALRSRIADEDLISMQEGLGGLERDGPSEIRTRSEKDDDGNVEDIVETVDTFRFTMSKAELERAMGSSKRQNDVAQDNSEESYEEEIDAGRRLLADKDFLERLEGAEYEIREDGKKVLRVELDMDELGSMLGAAVTNQDSTNDDDGSVSRKGARRSTDYDSDLMNQAQERVTLSLQDVGDIPGTGSTQEERDLVMFESGPGKPRWDLSGVGPGPVVADLVGSVGVIVGYAGVLKAASVAGHRAVRCMRLAAMKKAVSRFHGVTVPWLSLGVLVSYVGFHSVQHYREGRRFQGIGFASPRKNLLKRLLPGLLDI